MENRSNPPTHLDIWLWYIILVSVQRRLVGMGAIDSNNIENDAQMPLAIQLRKRRHRRYVLQSKSYDTEAIYFFIMNKAL